MQRKLLPLACVLPVVVALPTQAQHRAAMFHATPPVAFVGVPYQVHCSLVNFDESGDTHWWTGASIQFQQADELYITGNLLTNGATVTIYFNDIVQGTRTVTNGIVELPGMGWGATVTATYTARALDAGVLVSYGTCEGVDLHDNIPGGGPNFIGAIIGSQTEVRVPQLLLAFRGDGQIEVQFVQPPGIAMGLETSTDQASWVNAEAFPAVEEVQSVVRRFPADDHHRFFRLSLAPFEYTPVPKADLHHKTGGPAPIAPLGRTAH